MLKRIFLAILILGIVLIPAYAGDKGTGKDCKKDQKCQADQKCTQDQKCKQDQKCTQDQKCKQDQKCTQDQKCKQDQKCQMDKKCMGGQPCQGGCTGMCGGNCMPSNPLDPMAKKFIQEEVGKIAILPFSDYSIRSPIPSTSYMYWASRRIHDFMTDEFISIGKLVVPYDTMYAALSEVRGGTSSGLFSGSSSGCISVVSPNEAKKAFSAQVSDLRMSSTGSNSAMDFVFPGSQGMAGSLSDQILSLDLTSAEIISLGKALDVDAIFMGSISDYGTTSGRSADAYTLLPPFLGLWNPTDRSQIRMIVYLYETKTGELIWAAMEEVEYQPGFPLFSDKARNYDKLNRNLAIDIVDHFRNRPKNQRELRVLWKQEWGPGDTRKEKDIHKVIKGEY